MDNDGHSSPPVPPSEHHRALQLPEILYRIIGMLSNDRRTLLNAIRVNSRWFECGILTLWHSPPPSAFGQLGPHRRQMYAAKAVVLEFPDIYCFHTGILDLSFPKLRTVVYKSHHPYIFPSLIAMSQSFNLRQLVIHLYPRGMDVGSLTSLLEANPSLEKLTMNLEVSTNETETLWVALAKLERLKCLESPRLGIRESWPREINKLVPAPFSMLQKLDAKATIQALPHLVQMFSRLKALRIAVPATLDSLDPLSDLSDLQSLVVLLHPSLFARTASLGGPRSLTLEKFTIEADSLVLTDDGLASLLANVPCLRSLKLHFALAKGSPLLQVLSAHCKNLVKLRLVSRQIPQRLTIPELEYTLFPRLNKLEFRAFRPPKGPYSYDCLAGRLSRQFPAMEYFAFSDPDEFNETLWDAWRRRKSISAQIGAPESVDA